MVADVDDPDDDESEDDDDGCKEDCECELCVPIPPLHRLRLKYLGLASVLLRVTTPPESWQPSPDMDGMRESIDKAVSKIFREIP